MTTTGRIKSPVRPEVAAIVFGDTSNTAIENELEHYTRVDLAHVVMLEQAGAIGRETAGLLLRALRALRSEGFAPLRGKPTPRGIYLLYEGHLIQTLGSSVGGWLQLGRSRNDLSATVTKLRLRAPCAEVSRALAALTEQLCVLAERWAETIMPAYTHYQPAVPVTYGHYCAGVGSALIRDREGLVQAASELDSCPLGACAVGGTSVPIRPEVTAGLLGFARPMSHSIDAVASRDFVLRILAALTVLGVTLSRVASDLLLWSTEEFGLLVLPDHVVGSSSIMPQKRNPYLLEHVQGRAVAALGGFCSAVATMAKAPFSNAIAVGTEGVKSVWDGLRSTHDALLLLTEVVAAAEPQPAAMLARVETGATSATHCAELLSAAGVPFRSAHHQVGQLVTEALALGRPFSEVATAALASYSIGPLSGERAGRESRYGGGPSPENVVGLVAELRGRARELDATEHARERRWVSAGELLDAEVQAYLRQEAPT